MHDVDLRQLRTLVTVVEQGTFGRAGDVLGYSQSTVSQHVSGLERTVGGALFDRPGGPRPVRLTPLGQLVLERGRRLLAGAEELAESVDRFLAGGGRVDIGTFHSLSAVILPTLVRRMRDEVPGCEIRLFEGEPEDPRIGELDLLFHDAPVSGPVESVKLWDDPYVVVAPEGVLADGRVAVADLDGRAVLAWPEVCDQPRLESALRAHGCRPDVVFRSASTEALLAMARSGMGVALLPRLAVGTAPGSDPVLRVHELEPTLCREIYLHWPSGRTQSPAAVHAVRIAREIAEAEALGHP